MKKTNNFKLGCLALAISQTIAVSAHAQTSIVVNTASDTRASETCTLRAAIIAANDNVSVDACTAGGISNDVIEFSNDLLNSTITLNSPLSQINSNITINGIGQANLTISGNNQHRIFYINNSTAIINNIKLSNGNTVASGGGIRAVGASLTINNSAISDNYASVFGGGISCFNNSNIIISNSTISNNVSGNDGGGIDMFYYCDNTIINSTISSNYSGNKGGGISSYEKSDVVIINSTISGNSSVNTGGGIYIFDSISNISNSIISGSSTLQNGNEISVSNSSITLNNNILGTSASTLNEALGDSEIDSSNIIATSDDGNFSLNQIIAPLSDNGGPTLTHGLVSGSPVIDAGDNSLCISNNITTDQRGEARANSGDDPCDIGSFEGLVQQDETLFTIPLPNGRTIIFGL